MEGRDPLGGADGTQPGRRYDDPTTAPAADTDLRLPPPGDHDAVARWMDEDATRTRYVPPPRPIPPQRRHRVLPPENPETPAAIEGDPADEPAWMRERREEAEFRAQFGEWRAGGARPAPRSGFGAVRLGAPLIVLIAVLIAVFALAMHL